jgi:uncharacterized protein YwgA
MTEKPAFDPTELDLTDDDLVKESITQSVIVAAGGSITGRTRLQKLVFLLDQLGLESGFIFAYHHYGPYSSDLTDAVDFSKAFGMVVEDFKHRESDGARYSIFLASAAIKSNPRAEFLARNDVKSAIDLMNTANATVLELAATVYWLKYHEKCRDWRDEIVKRKGQKTENGRLQKALDLLTSINLKIDRFATA